MYKHIMVAVDGSETSDLALLEAITIAKEHGSKLHVVHVFDEIALSFSAHYPEAAEFKKYFIDSGKEVLSIAKTLAQKRAINVETIFLQSAEGISKKLADYAKTWPADLLVIGTHGRKGIERFLLGSVAEKLVRLATVPVLLVPSKKH